LVKNCDKSKKENSPSGKLDEKMLHQPKSTNKL
jgi:hypothetical protein